MRPNALLVSLLVVLPSIAAAQYPVRGVGSPRRGDGGGLGSLLKQQASLPTSGDLEKQDPIVIMLEKKEQLALADSQVSRLIQLDTKLMHDNRPLLRELDSLRASRASDGSESAEPRREIVQSIRGIRANYEAATQEALALLTDQQREKASRIIKDETDRLEKSRPKESDGRSPSGPSRRR